jgi:hypothetical protein
MAAQAGAATGVMAMKTRRRNRTKLKRLNAPTARDPAAADLQKQLDQRTRDLAEARELAQANGRQKN